MQLQTPGITGGHEKFYTPNVCNLLAGASTQAAKGVIHAAVATPALTCAGPAGHAMLLVSQGAPHHGRQGYLGLSGCSHAVKVADFFRISRVASTSSGYVSRASP